ncbi:hypothetical protein L484_007941 [Morus notabilis]|uniref:Uncharacterized protein n=1 Tax=Morus notabilis TaxID=981085 RepID=W9S9R8_9ROSA|nr:hypothetical protein L484_007941 [Morus notabilis]
MSKLQILAAVASLPFPQGVTRTPSHGIASAKELVARSECNKDHMFPHLSKLFIEDCPELVSFPLFPTLEEGLVPDSCSSKPFQETLMVKAKDMRFQTCTRAYEASSSTSVNARSSSFLSPLSKLKNLSIVGIEELDDEKADEIMLQKITSLQEIHIWRCNFTILQERIIELKLLKKLSISICPNLKSLPEKIGSLTSLQTLEIKGCPALLHRCQRKAGADWDKISHIPDLRLDMSSRN